MSLKQMKKYLPADKPARVPFQTRVEPVLLTAVANIRLRDGLSWQELIEALFKRYVDESKREGA